MRLLSTQGPATYCFFQQSYITFPGLVSTKIDVWLNGQANDPVFKWYLNDLKINLPNKSYSRDNRLNILDSSH